MMEDAQNNARKAMETAEYWARMWYKTQINWCLWRKSIKNKFMDSSKIWSWQYWESGDCGCGGIWTDCYDNEVWLGSKRMEESNGKTDFFSFFSWLCRSVLQDAGMTGIPFHTKDRCG